MLGIGTMLRKQGLTSQIILAMVFGVIIGGLLREVYQYSFVEEYIVHGFLHVIGQVFVISLKMLVVPLVFISLVSGTSALGDPKKLGRVGGKTLVFYLGTTALAVAIALAMAYLVGPGKGFNRPAESEFHVGEAPSLSQMFIDLFPENPVKAMADGNMLQIIVFAILTGIAISLLGKKSDRIRILFDDLNEIIMKMVTLLMYVAPYGVFALLAKVFAEQGLGAILPMAKYFFLVLFVLLLHMFVSYGVLLKAFSGLKPFVLFKKMRPVMLFGFSTASSNATLPVTMDHVEHRLGVNNSIASFTLPLGSTVNMDGTAIMQGVATVFIAQAYNQGLMFTDYLMVIMTATLASVGTAGVPGVGLITLAMVLQQVGLPVQGIGLIIGVDRLLDMVRTAVNITGDAMVSCIVAKSEGQFNEQVYYDPTADEEVIRNGST